MVVGPLQRWLLLATAAGGLAFAAAVHLARWDGRLVAAAGVLALVAAGHAAHWGAAHYGSGRFAAFTVPIAVAVAAAVALGHVAYRHRGALPVGRSSRA